MEAGRDEPAFSCTATLPASFPYVPGYLAYRELPIHAELIRQAIDAGWPASLLLVDGAGILHPRRSGIACQLGVLAGVPTIGVTKHRLCGTTVMDDAFGPQTGRVVEGEETIAAALPPSPRGHRPIYVSPGHRCSVTDAVSVVNAWRNGLRLPEPIRRADALSRSLVRAALESG
jgi:deoxyribonuclease V